MKLKYFKRSADKKSESNRVRLEGNIPAVIYVQGQESNPIAISNAEFSALLRQVQQGRLSTTIFTLVDENGGERKVLIKDLQYGVPDYEIIHLDFEELHEDRKVNVKVPIECVGQADCVGVKLGGVLRQVIRHLLVNCLPKDIPVAFELDVRSMGIRDSRRLSALSIPEGVRPVADLKEVAAVIVKR